MSVDRIGGGAGSTLILLFVFRLRHDAGDVRPEQSSSAHRRPS